MTLTLCSDLTAAQWLVDSGLLWHELVSEGPGDYEAYARLHFAPDPADSPRHPGSDVSHDVPREGTQWRILSQILVRETRDPSDCFFALWNGWGFPDITRQWPTFGVPNGVAHPARVFFLLHGSLREIGEWGRPELARGSFEEGGAPAFVWPADRTWCVAKDVDFTWAEVGGPSSLIEALAGSHVLDVVRVARPAS